MNRLIPYALAALSGLIVSFLIVGLDSCADVDGVRDAQARADSLEVVAMQAQDSAGREMLAADRAQEQAAALADINALLARQLESERESADRQALRFAEAQRDAARDLERSDAQPESLPRALSALTTCTAARSACSALADSQRIALNSSESMIETQEAQIRQLDTATVRLRRANGFLGSSVADLTLALESEAMAGKLLGSEVRRQKRRVLFWQAATGAVAAGATYLLTR